MTTVTRTTSVEVDARFFRNTSLDGSGKAYVDGPRSVYQNTRTVDDVTTDFKNRIPRGISATTTMSGVLYGMTSSSWGKYETVVESFSQGKLTSTQTYRFFGVLSSCPMPTPESSVSGYNRANNMALMEFYKYSLKAQRGFQALVTGGELGESLRMIRSPARALRELLFTHRQDVKKRLGGKRYSAENLRRVTAGMWLEAVFGWKPLLSDIESGAEALSRIMTFTPDRVPVRGRGIDVRTEVEGSEFYREWGPLKLRIGPNVTTYTNSVRIYGSVGMQPRDISGMARQFGVSWSDVAPALWELLPYSFLADYFTNIGAVIDACSTGSSNVKWVNRGWEKKASRKRSYIRPDTFIYQQPTVRTRSTIFQPEDPCEMTVRSILREPIAELGLPSLEFRVPGMSTKWINIAALLSARKQDLAVYGRRG